MKAFTLLELMVAVLLGALAVAMIAGTLNSSIGAWEAGQTRISENYERRTVLDLVKRQSSSIFYRREADSLARQDSNNRFPNRQQTPPQGRDRQPNNRRMNPNARAERDNANNRSNVRNDNQQAQFTLPGGSHYFKGAVQGISFLSTVSFLSDFPGQCAVKYYVVQSDPDSEDGHTQAPEELDPEDGYLDGDYEEIEGGLWLVVEEKNLFVVETQQADEAQQLFPQEPPEKDDPEPNDEFYEDDPPTEDEDEYESIGDIESTQRMALIGPLRKFSIRYRIPKKQLAEEADSDEDWAETWDYNNDNGYPSAIEFILVYEKPGVDDDTETEDLPGVRMVIPVYDLQNMRRDRTDVPF